MNSEDAIDYIQKILQLICGRNVKRHLHIQFFGGEPLTNKDAIKAVLHKFEDGVRYGVELSYSIVTNGSLIDNEMAELFSKYNVAVIVSFDNPNKSDRIMKSGNNSIDKTKEVLKILQRFDAYVAFNSVLSEYTYDYFDTTIILVSKKFALLKKPVNPSRFRTHPAVPELSALCIILAVFLKGGKNVSADSA